MRNIFTDWARGITLTAKLVGDFSKSIFIGIKKTIYLILNYITIVINKILYLLSFCINFLVKLYFSFESGVILSMQWIVFVGITIRWSFVVFFFVYLIYIFFGKKALIIAIAVSALMSIIGGKDSASGEAELYQFIDKINTFFKPYFKWSVRIIAILASFYMTYSTVRHFFSYYSSSPEEEISQRIDIHKEMASSAEISGTEGKYVSQDAYKYNEEKKIARFNIRRDEEKRQIEKDVENQQRIVDYNGNLAGEIQLRVIQEEIHPEPHPPPALSYQHLPTIQAGMTKNKARIPDAVIPVAPRLESEVVNRKSDMPVSGTARKKNKQASLTEIRNSMNNQDNTMFYDALRRNKFTSWRSISGNMYTVNPINSYTNNNKFCRNYIIEAEIRRVSLKSSGIACRTIGEWSPW